MRTYRWLTLGAAVTITALEVWLFTTTSALASQPDAPAATARTHSAVVASLSIDPANSIEPASGEVAAASNTAAPAESDTGQGEALYSQYCAPCHQANGAGVAGTFPPLKASAVVNRADATKHIDIVLSGLQGARVSGVTYSTAMPGFGATLSDAAIAAIIDYERGAWGNHGALISPAQVANARAHLK